jgi:hypothetical protein
MRHLIVRLLLLLLAGTAIAAPAAAAAASPRFTPARHAVTHFGHGYNINGYNWGGFAATGSGFTSISATWTEPTATCNSTNDLYAPWVGIDGYGSSTVEQTGVATDCSSGRAVYQAWYEMYPRSPVYISTSTYPVSPGNVIHASVSYVSGSSYKLTLQNTSRGWTYTTTKSLSGTSRVSAEVIIESPTGAYPNFGTISFSSATVNGNSLGTYGPVALDPSNNSGYEAHTSALSGGTSFSIQYLRE